MQVLLSNIVLIFTFALIGYFFFFIPGKLLNNKFLNNQNDFVISILLGFSLFTLISFFIYAINLKISYAIIFYIIFYLIITSIFYSIFKQKLLIKNHYLNKNNLIYFFPIFFFLVLIFLIRPIYIQNDGSDMWYYLAIIRSFLDDGFFSNTSPWFNMRQSSYPSNSFFLLLTMIKYLLPNISLFDIFRISGVFLTTLSVFINIQVLNFFTKNIKYSFSIVLFIFVLSFLIRDNLIYYMSSLPYYPKIFSSVIFIPALIYIFFSRLYLRKFFPIFLIFIFITYLNQSSINIVISGILIFAFLILEIKKNILIAKVINIFIPYVIVVLFGYFYLSGFYFEKSGVISTFSNDLSINASNDGPYFGHVTEIFRNLYIYNPVKYFSRLTYFYLLLLLLSVLCYKFIRFKEIFLYHYIILIVSFLIVFNPVSIFILNKLLPIYFLVRINWILVGYIFLGCLIYEIIDRSNLQKYIYKFLFVSSSICCLILSQIFYTKYDVKHLDNIKEFEKYIENIKPNTFIVTDKYTSNKVLALKKTKFLISHEAWLKSITPELNFTKYYNIYDKHDLFLNNNNILKYLIAIKADYLLINKHKTKNFKILKDYKNLNVIFENEIYILAEL